MNLNFLQFAEFLGLQCKPDTIRVSSFLRITTVVPKRPLRARAVATLYLYLDQRTLTYFARGSITVHLTSCLTGLDSAALPMFYQLQIYLFGQIQTSQTGGHMYSDTFTYEKESLLCLDVLYFQDFLGHVKSYLSAAQ